MIRNPDREVQEHVFRIYNEMLADTCRRHPGRLYGVGICSNWWDPKKAHEAIGQIVDLGLSTFMLPALNPGKTPDGEPISFGGPEMDAFWSEAADAGLPVSFHVGENLTIGPRSAAPASILVSFDPFRKPVGEIMFGGVLDRHPDLRFFFAEAGIAWVPPMLQHAEGSSTTTARPSTTFRNGVRVSTGTTTATPASCTTRSVWLSLTTSASTP